MKSTPGDLLSILAKNYPPPYWAFMREFRNAVAFDATRSADALAVGLYRSRGQVIVGFEKKVYRSDWLRELKRPEKAEPIAQFCDYFNVVTPDISIAKPEEIPAPWGLIVVDHVKGKAQVVKNAELLTAAAITRPFMCAIIKQAMDAAGMPGAQALMAARQEGFEEGQKNAENLVPYELKDLRKLKAEWEAFEKASGIAISSYEDGGHIGKAALLVRQMLATDYSTVNEIDHARQTLERAGALCASILTELKALGEKSREAAA